MIMNQALNILIVEDEPLAAAQLASLIGQIEPNARIVAMCDTVKSTIQWIQENPSPDLAFFDIQLGDGYSFEAIDAGPELTFPIIFTTAFDQYTLQAFKTNSIDYLLKPLNRDELKGAFAKFKQLYTQQNLSLEKLRKIVLHAEKPRYKSRFVVKVGTHLRQIEVKSVSFFYSEAKASFVQLENGKNYLIDFALDHLEQMIDPTLFYRINRKYIISHDAIDDMCYFSSNKLRIKLKLCRDSNVFVARDRLKNFRAWLEGESIH